MTYKTKRKELPYWDVHHQGRIYTTCLFFIKEKRANQFLAKNPDHGILFEEGHTICTAKLKDQGEAFEGNSLCNYRKLADSCSDKDIHKGEVWLYFNDHEKYTAACKAVSHLLNVRGFKSPKDAPQQLEYTIHIEKPVSDYFEEKPLALKFSQYLKAAGIDFKSCGDFGTGYIVFSTSKSWTYMEVKSRLSLLEGGGFEVKKHHLTNDITNHYLVQI